MKAPVRNHKEALCSFAIINLPADKHRHCIFSWAHRGIWPIRNGAFTYHVVHESGMQEYWTLNTYDVGEMAYLHGMYSMWFSLYCYNVKEVWSLSMQVLSIYISPDSIHPAVHFFWLMMCHHYCERLMVPAYKISFLLYIVSSLKFGPANSVVSD